VEWGKGGGLVVGGGGLDGDGSGQDCGGGEGKRRKLAGRWGCCESLGGETRRWEEIYKVLLRRFA